MDNEKKVLRTRKGLKEYTYLGCPLTNNNTAWCFRICQPDAQGNGRCGRLAPHSMKSYIQQGIIDFKKKKARLEHWEFLEQAFLAGPLNKVFDFGIHVSGAQSDIILAPRENSEITSDVNSLCLKLLHDSAVLAVLSILDVEPGGLITESFNAQLSGQTICGELAARGRFINLTGNQYLAESILSDSDRNEIGRASALFLKRREC